MSQKPKESRCFLNVLKLILILNTLYITKKRVHLMMVNSGMSKR